MSAIPVIPKVSVCMITFNHAPYIGQAIESVLAQVAKFNIELVIGEDCSTDGTRDIVLEYQRRHPDRIRALCHRQNVGAKKNAQMTLHACRGEYVALLEGDDYWIAPDKLEAQVALLDENPEAFLCGARSYVLSEGEESPTAVLPAEDSDTLANFGARELFEGYWWFRTGTKVFRRSVTQRVPERFAGDWAAIMWLIATTDFGPIVFLDRIVAVYRLHSGGVWTSKSRHEIVAADIATLFHLVPVFRAPEQQNLRIRMKGLVEELVSIREAPAFIVFTSAFLTAFRHPRDRRMWVLVIKSALGRHRHAEDPPTGR